KAARHIERHVEGRTVERIEDETVRDDDHRVACMTVGDAFETAHTARAELPGAFPARHHEIRLASRKRGVVLRMARFDLAVGQAFEYAEAALAQIAVGNDLVPGQVGDAPRGLMRAPQIAAVEHAESDILEPARKLTRLLQSCWREWTVALALHAMLLVPLGLAVAHKKNFGHRTNRKW